MIFGLFGFHEGLGFGIFLIHLELSSLLNELELLLKLLLLELFVIYSLATDWFVLKYHLFYYRWLWRWFNTLLKFFSALLLIKIDIIPFKRLTRWEFIEST